MPRILSALIWIGISLLGAGAFGYIALARGETIGAAWLIVADVCTYLIAYRFYSKFIAEKVFELNPKRATPAERLNNGRDFVPTNKWILFGHHFSAISGAGPLVGPTLAAQFGFLPGTIWLIAGVVLGGAVQDFLILCASMRRDGKSLGQIAKEEVNPVAGLAANYAGNSGGDPAGAGTARVASSIPTTAGSFTSTDRLTLLGCGLSPTDLSAVFLVRFWSVTVCAVAVCALAVRACHGGASCLP